jgi:hypothetical protein
MWASAASTKVIVTTQVEWTGRSFIKGWYSCFLFFFSGRKLLTNLRRYH